MGERKEPKEVSAAGVSVRGGKQGWRRGRASELRMPLSLLERMAGMLGGRAGKRRRPLAAVWEPGLWEGFPHP